MRSYRRDGILFRVITIEHREVCLGLCEKGQAVSYTSFPYHLGSLFRLPSLDQRPAKLKCHLFQSDAPAVRYPGRFDSPASPYSHSDNDSCRGDPNSIIRLPRYNSLQYDL